MFKRTLLVLACLTAFCGCGDDDPPVVPPVADAAEISTDTGALPACDDGNACTFDERLVNGVCHFVPLWDAECVPLITLQTPPRAGSVDAVGVTVPVSGTATAKSATLAKVTLGGVEVAVGSDGAFSGQITPEHGINIVAAEATDTVGVSARAVHALVASDSFYKTTAGPSESAVVPNALFAWLGAAFWDDDDPSDVDDLATVARLVIEGLDIPAMLAAQPPPREPNPILDCLVIESVSYKVGDIDLVPTKGAIALSAVVEDLAIGFSTKTEGDCIDAKGTLTAVAVSAEGQLLVDIGEDGAITVTVPEVVVEIVDQEVVLDGDDTTSALIVILLAAFEGPVTEQLEQVLEDTVKNNVAETLAGALTQFSTSTLTFDLPPLPGQTAGLSVDVGVRPTAIELTPDGGSLALGVQITSPIGPALQAAGIDSPGAVARGACGASDEAALPKDQPVAMSLHDDIVNQLLFAAWWGGILHAEIAPSVFDAISASGPFGIGAVALEPHMPPVLTQCRADGTLQMQVGDLKVQAELEVNGAKGAVTAWASARVIV